MDAKEIIKLSTEISNLLDESVADLDQEEAFQAIANACVRLSTYPLVFLDAETRQKFIPQFAESIKEALVEFDKYIRKSEVN